SDSKRICIPKLCDVPTGKFCIPIANPRPVPVELKAGTTVGFICAIEKERTDRPYITSRELTEEQLDNLVYGPDLTPEQLQKLRALLKRYGDRFAYSLDQIGKARSVEFTIDTGDAPPKAVPPYRKSPEARRIINAEV